MAKRKKDYSDRCNELLKMIQDAIRVTEERDINFPITAYIYLSENDSKAINKYINWDKSNNELGYKIGSSSKLSTDKVKLVMMQVPNNPKIPQVDLSEPRIIISSDDDYPQKLAYPLTTNKPASYSEALENVRGLAKDIYMNTVSGKEEDNEE